MNAEGYLGDFDRFLRAGRIGAVAARLDVFMDNDVLAPDAREIRGEVVADAVHVRSVAWRMRGELEWNRIQARAGQFAVRGPGRAGVLEIRCTGSADSEPGDLVSWAFVELAWPQGFAQLREGPRSVVRHGPLLAVAEIGWLESLELVHADGSVTAIEVAGRHGAVEIPLRSNEVGVHHTQLRWQARDGTAGSCEFHYAVTARPIALEIYPRRGGGYVYRTEHADAIELELPGQAAPIPMPAQGVIECSVLMPVRATLNYRDESGEWQSRCIVLDYAPRTWARLSGFRHP